MDIIRLQVAEMAGPYAKRTGASEDLPKQAALEDQIEVGGARGDCG